MVLVCFKLVFGIVIDMVVCGGVSGGGVWWWWVGGEFDGGRNIFGGRGRDILIIIFCSV